MNKKTKDNLEMQITYVAIGQVVVGVAYFIWSFLSVYVLVKSRFIDGVLLVLDSIFIQIPINAQVSYSKKLYKLIAYYQLLSSLFFAIVFSGLDVFCKNDKYIMKRENKNKTRIDLILFCVVFIASMVYTMYFANRVPRCPPAYDWARWQHYCDAINHLIAQWLWGFCFIYTFYNLFAFLFLLIASFFKDCNISTKQK